MHSSERGQIAAGYARDNAREDAAGFAGLSTKMCWDAVKHCLEASNALPKAELDAMQPASIGYESFVRPDDPVVAAKSDVRRLRRGAILGFIDLDNGHKLIHAMISVGAGMAAGTKNECIGIGKPIGWEILDLGTLHWVSGSDWFHNTSSGRRVRIKYRDI